MCCAVLGRVVMPECLFIGPLSSRSEAISPLALLVPTSLNDSLHRGFAPGARSRAKCVRLYGNLSCARFWVFRFSTAHDGVRNEFFIFLLDFNRSGDDDETMEFRRLKLWKFRLFGANIVESKSNSQIICSISISMGLYIGWLPKLFCGLLNGMLWQSAL